MCIIIVIPNKLFIAKLGKNKAHFPLFAKNEPHIKQNAGN